MKKKLIVLGFSSIGSLAALMTMFSVETGLCSNFDVGCVMKIDLYEKFLRFFILIFIFSVLTLGLRKEAFQCWLKFSYVAVPIGFLISGILVLNFYHTRGGFFNPDNIADLIFLVFICGGYTLGSLIAIYRGYQQSKMGKTGMAAGKRVGDGGRVI